jgi:hypothetical protein
VHYFLNFYFLSGFNIDPDLIRKFTTDILNEISKVKPSSIPVSGTNTHYGHAIIESLRTNSRINTLFEEGIGPAIISAELIKKAEEMFELKLKESELVNLYTPTLMEVLHEVNPHLRLVNSEAYPWLQQCELGKFDMKPDLFSAHHPMVQYMPAYKNAPTCEANRHFGKFIS